jgi:hypothetical protein
MGLLGLGIGAVQILTGESATINNVADSVSIDSYTYISRSDLIDREPRS